MSIKKLKNLAVETASGTKLGHVCDVVLETEGQLVAQYEVKNSIFSGANLLISRDQIVRFEYNPSTSLRANKIIVDDSVKKAENKNTVEKTEINPEPISLRKSA